MNLIVLLLIAFTLLVLIVGLTIMIRGGTVSKKYSNKFMIARVVLQFLAIGTLALMALFPGS